MVWTDGQKIVELEGIVISMGLCCTGLGKSPRPSFTKSASINFQILVYTPDHSFDINLFYFFGVQLQNCELSFLSKG